MKKNHYHVKGVTVRASDTVKLNLKVRFVKPDNTCSEKNNVGHSLRCHTGIKKRSKLSELQLVRNLVCNT